MDEEDAAPLAVSLPWIEKYRPSALEDLVAHEEIISVLTRLIDNNQLPHLLFYGPPGTGKTSTILACARKMYGEKFNNMILELNASDDRGIDVVRDRIKEFAGTKNMFSSQVKLIVLDEADAMTSEAQAALRRVIEKFTTNTRFCMICNYVNKIIPALQSRCTKFRFSPLRPEQIVGRLDHIIRVEGVNATESGRAAILSLACGDLRRVLNLLQTTQMAYKIVDEQSVFLTAGAAVPAVIDHFLHTLMHESFDVAFKTIIDGISAYGYALSDILTELTVRVTQLELPNEVLVTLMDKLSDIEYRLSHGASEKLQLGSLVAAFIIGRQMMTA